MKDCTIIMEELLACRICLATEVKLLKFEQNQWIHTYEVLSGTQYQPADHLPHHICRVCLQSLLKCAVFRDRCRTSCHLLNQLVLEHPITTSYLSKLDKSLYNLNHPFITNKNYILSIDNGFVSEENVINYKEVNDIIVKNESELNEDYFNDSINDTVIDTFIDTLDNFSSDEEPLSKIVRKNDKKVKTECHDHEIKIDKESRKKHRKKIKQTIKTGEQCDNNKLITEKTYDRKILLNNKNKELKRKITPKQKKVRVYNAQDLKFLIDHDIDIIYLTKEEQKQQVDSRKTSNNYVMSEYKCHLCLKGFMSDVTYENHMVIHDTSRGGHICDICQSAFSSSRNLASHVANAHSRNFVCKKCNGVFKSCHKAKEHIKWHQGVVFKCSFCDASFRKRTTFMTHVRMRHQSGITCDICGQSFSGPYGLNMHVKKSHRGLQLSKSISNTCQHCSTKFKTIEALEKHTGSADSGICNPKMIPCHTCGESFDSQTIGQHMITHKSTKRYNCEQCNKSYATAASYAIHRQRNHSTGPNLHASAALSFVCEHCGITCSNKHTLVNHIRRHTGEKPFQCTMCEKRFTLAQRLQIHIRTHTGERPFKCAMCPKGFTHKAGLNRHMAVHTGAKPYTCAHCQKSFSQSNSLKIHIHTVHLKLPAPYRRSNKKDFTFDINQVSEGS